MVTITNCFLTQEGTPNEHVVLELTGPVHFFYVHMAHGFDGQVYATAGTVLFPSTLSLETARNLIGTQVSGTIRRMKAKTQRMKLPDSSTEISIDYNYQYIPESDELFMPGFPDIQPPATNMDIMNEQLKKHRQKKK